MTGPIRKLAPQKGRGPRYELFDGSIYFMLLAVLSYTALRTYIAEPPPKPLPYQIAGNPYGLVALLAVGTFGAVCAYFPKMTAIGFTTLVTAASFWSGMWLLGYLGTEAGLFTVFAAVVYGNLASTMYRDNPGYGIGASATPPEEATRTGRGE